MNFLENIFEQLGRSAGRPVLQEIRGGQIVSVTGAELLAQIRTARSFLHKAGFQRGDRCALLAHNSIRWVAADLALMAEGIIVVPLYPRQAPAELAAVLKDSQSRSVLCANRALAEVITSVRPGVPACVLFDDLFEDLLLKRKMSGIPESLAPGDILTIIYTSGTSGEPKGVCLTVGNLDHMLACTTQRLDELMGPTSQPDRVFHYLPFNFAGSWILMLSCLSRRSVLALSTDLNKLPDEIRLSGADYFLNVPTLLERIRRGVEDQVRRRDGLARTIFEKGRTAWDRRQSGHGGPGDAFWFVLARFLVFRKIRERLGLDVRALICGSAPLAQSTQEFFAMLGIHVLQVYGLTETTGICTMDDPGDVLFGFVGPAIPGVEMVLGENQEILVRGPNLFPGYWNRPEETSRVLREGWFHTGDQGEVNAAGNWRIIGRIKNLIILSSGHNIAPEPIEEELLNLLPGVQHVVLLGNGRGYMAALITGGVAEPAVSAALDTVNRDLPHYKQVHAFHLVGEPLTIENGLLTVNGKPKRDAIATRFASEIEAMYQRKTL